jgi:thymidylate kinase
MNSVAALIFMLATPATTEQVGRYVSLIAEASLEHDIDPLLIVATIHHETGGRWDPNVVGRTRDYGLMQTHVSKSTNPQFRGREHLLLDPRVNIQVGVSALAYWKKYHFRSCKKPHKWWSHYKWGYNVKNNYYGRTVGKIYDRLRRWNSKMIIVVEGIDASGKATQTKRLAEHFHGQRIAFPRYETPVGMRIKSKLEEGGWNAIDMQALMLYDKSEAAPEIKSWGDSTMLILDRYWQAGYAYGVADGLDGVSFMRTVSGLPMAHLNIFLDIPVSLVRERRGIPRDHYEKDLEKMEKVRANYRTLWSGAPIRPAGGWVTVDGNRPADIITKEMIELIYLAKGVLDQQLGLPTTRSFGILDP